MSWLIIVFWIFVATMLIWQFNDYNRSYGQAQAAMPQEDHAFFYNTNTAINPAEASKPKADGPDVEQTAFSTEDNVPSPGNFTAHVTLKNIGTAKAVDIQIMVRPYRGIMMGDFDITMHPNTYLDDNDPLSQYGQFVNVPDLAPGESATVDAIFLDHPHLTPGNNPKPQIIFGTEKAQ
jgi:hypothetical protein